MTDKLSKDEIEETQREIDRLEKKLKETNTDSGQLALPYQYKESLRRVYEDLEKLDQLHGKKPTKEQVLACLERIFNELEEGKIVLAPSIRDRL